MSRLPVHSDAAGDRRRDGGRRARVLAVDHTVGVAPFRKKFEALASFDDIELTVLAPTRWIENYRVVEAPKRGEGFRVIPGRVVFPGYNNRSFYVTGLARALLDTRPDIVDLYEEAFSLFFLQSAVLARLLAPHAKIVFHASDSLSWGNRYPYRPSWLYASIQRYAHRVASAAFTINDVAREILESKGFERPVWRAFHGIDESEFRPTDASGLRAKLGLEGPVVGYLGRLIAKKGVNVLVEAVSSMRPAPELLIVGDGERRQALEALARERGIEAKTRFVPAVPHEEVPLYLNAMDVVVLPSIRSRAFNEPFGRVLVEAMACGIPVVGTTCGSMGLVLGDAGVIVPEGDAAALARAVEGLLADPGRRRELSRLGRARVLEHYTWRRFAEIVHAGYQEILRP